MNDPQLPNAKEHLSLTASSKQSDDDESIVEKMIADLREALPGLLTDISSSGRSWLRGKSEQEVARAREILSHAIDRIGRLALDEQEMRHRHRLETSSHRMEMQSKEADLYLQALERAVSIVKDLNELGVDVDVKQVVAQIPGVSIPPQNLSLEEDPKRRS